MAELPHLVDPQALKVFEIISCSLLSPKGSLALERLTQAEPIPYGTGKSPLSSPEGSSEATPYGTGKSACSRVRTPSKLSACQCTII